MQPFFVVEIFFEKSKYLIPRHAQSLILCSLYNKRQLLLIRNYKENSMIAGETAMKILMRWGRVWPDWDSHDNSTL